MSSRAALNVLLPVPGADLQSWAQQLTERLQSVLTRLTYDNNTEVILYKLLPIQDSSGRTILDPAGIHIYGVDDFEVVNGPVIRVRTEELVDNAITTSKLASGSITSTKIEDGAITTPKLTANAVTAGKIAANAIVANDGVIGTAAIADAQIATLNASKINAGSIAAERMRANLVTALEGQFATLGALAASLGAVRIRPGGKLYTESAVDLTTGTGVVIMEDKIRAGSSSSQLLWDGTKLVLGNPSGSRVEVVSGTLTIYDASGTVLLSSGGKIPWTQIVGAGKPQDGATVGADVSNLNIGLGTNLLANTEFVGGTIAPAAVSWNPGGCTGFAVDSCQPWIPPGIRIAYVDQGVRSNNQWGIGADVRFSSSPVENYWSVIPGRRYEFSAKVYNTFCDSMLEMDFLDANGAVIQYNSSGLVSRGGAGSSGLLATWTVASVFGVAPPTAAKVLIYWRRTETDVGQPSSSAWLCQPFFGEALASQTVPSTYSPGYAPGAFASLSKITAGNASTYIESAAIGNAQIGGDIWSSNFAYGSAGWLIRRDGYAEFMNVLARGNIEATSIKADAANIVSTLHLQGEAVTVPRSVYTNATLAGITSEVAVQSLYIDTQGSSVIIIFTCVHTYRVSFRILDPAGSVVYSGTNGDSLAAYKNFAVSCIGAVSGTYTVYASATSVAAVGQRGLVLLGAKR